MVRDKVVAAAAAASSPVSTAGARARVEVTAARVEVATAEELAAAPVVPAVVATAAVADLMAAVGDATGGAISGGSAQRRRVTSSPRVLGARVLATNRAHAHRMRRRCRLSCRCQKRISQWNPRRS